MDLCWVQTLLVQELEVRDYLVVSQVRSSPAGYEFPLFNQKFLAFTLFWGLDLLTSSLSLWENCLVTYLC